MLSPFPAEVLLMMAEYLPNNDLAALVRVNSFFHRTFVPDLYRCVEAMRPSTDSSTAAYPPLANEAYSRHVRAINVRPHDPADCAAVADHEILHLQLVRLFLTPNIFHTPLHEDELPKSSYGVPEGSDTHLLRVFALKGPCHFLRNVRSETLVIPEWSTELCDSLGALQEWMNSDVKYLVWFLPPGLSNLTSLKDLCWQEVIGPCVDSSRIADLDNLLMWVPVPVRSITFVVQHPAPSDHRGTWSAPLESFASALLGSPR